MAQRDPSREVPFRIISDVDVRLSQTALRLRHRRRIAVRVVLTRHECSEVALMYSHTERFYTLPGGGVHVHKREHIDHAALREVDEETGYDARLTHYLGVIEEHRGFRNHLERSHCFLAEVIGAPQEPMQTMYEQFMRFECQWFSYVDALRRLQANERHSTCVWDVTFRFIAKREIAILERARTFIERPLCPA